MSNRRKEPSKQLATSPQLNPDLVVPGHLLEWSGSLVEVKSRFGNTCQVADIHTGVISAIEVEQLCQPTRRRSRELNLEHVTSQQWARAQKVADVTGALVADDITDPKIIGREAAKLGIGVRQMSRWMSNYRASGGLTSSCLAQKPGRKRGKVMLNSRQVEAISKAIDKATSKAEASSHREIMRFVRDFAKDMGVKAPSKEAVQLRLQMRGISMSKRRRFGPEKAKEANTFKGGKNAALAPLEQVQIDHTQADVMVLDDSRTFSLGRPWLTLVICVHSRLILGFYLSLRAPSMLSVARAFTVAVMPKDKLLQSLGIRATWSAMGKPQEVLTDSAREFKSAAFVRGCEEHGIIPRLRPIGRKHWGGHIERAIGTIVGEMHLLPGTTFSNSVQKAGYAPEARAVLTVRELESWICRQIIIRNHQEHRSLQGWSPEIAWNDYWSRHPGEAVERQVSDLHRFYITLLPRHKATLRSSGIEWSTHRYYDPCLEGFPIRQRLEFAYDPSNIRRIWVFDPFDHRALPVSVQDEILHDDLSIDAALRAARRLQSRGSEKVVRQLESQSVAIVEQAKQAKQRAAVQHRRSSPVLMEALPATTPPERPRASQRHVLMDFGPDSEGVYVPQARLPKGREW